MPTAAAPPAADLAARAQAHLEVLAGPGATLRAEQLAAIDAVVAQGRRALVVQRTGFGKSAIYFIATKLLREAGAGPTLVVSPLLALMRDQVAAAERMGVRSATVNSTNPDDWAEIEAQVDRGELDLLCISPERLNNHRFLRTVLPGIAGRLGLLVIDEAHCISDWGHDFRPDYRRIRDAIAELAPGSPVLATTATANERVCADVAEQLGDDVLVLRGTLDRESLVLGVAPLASAAERLAWVAQRIPQLEGTGIVYCLTVAQTAEVSAFLRSQGIDARAYSSDTPTEERAALEADFKANRLKALVATSALGMGVDKPDVRFVLHLGAPPSPIAYYQQVGRAGRSVPTAEAWLLPGVEDQRIWAWFTAVGLPPEPLVRRVLDAVDAAGGSPISLPGLERAVDLRRARLETLLKILDVEGAVERVDGGWIATGRPWAYDRERIARIEEARAAEAAAMLDYGRADRCLMEQLRTSLDDPEAAPCGRCQVCTGAGDPVELDPAVLSAATAFLRGIDVVVEPRKQWPRGLEEPRGNLKPAEQADHGRALCREGDAGWWPAVAAALEGGCPSFDDAAVGEELVRGIAATLKRWRWVARPTWITWIPSSDPAREALLAEVAGRVGALGTLPVLPLVRRVHGGPPQATLANAAHRCRNVWGAFALDEAAVATTPPGPVLLLDDALDSGWTMTIVAALLRHAGAAAVLPFVLVRR
jgi:ATP-dependent DNA helicase RecQ